MTAEARAEVRQALKTWDRIREERPDSEYATRFYLSAETARALCDENERLEQAEQWALNGSSVALRSLEKMTKQVEQLQQRVRSLQIDRDALFAANSGLLAVNESLAASLEEP